MSTLVTDPRALYRGRQGRVDFVDVGECTYLSITGQGGPDGPAFADAAAALLAVSHAVTYRRRRDTGHHEPVMPLEALWWADATWSADVLAAVALGTVGAVDTDRRRWHWQAMVRQPAPLREADLDAARHRAERKELPALDRIRVLNWAEGAAAQILHVGAPAGQAGALLVLHKSIAKAGAQPRGRHHEIYLSRPADPTCRRSRTLLRQPLEPC